jgi:hypothetical protein
MAHHWINTTKCYLDLSDSHSRGGSRITSKQTDCSGLRNEWEVRKWRGLMTKEDINYGMTLG